MSIVLVAGAELYEELRAEKLAMVRQNESGLFDSEALCKLQTRVANRGVTGAEIVKSNYGYSVRYDSGLQDFGLLRPSRGAADPSLEAAEAFCREWVAAAPASRYAWKRGE